MSHHKVEFKNVDFSYEGKKNTLNSISFSIGHGESLGIVGANGAGKSTLLKMLVGVLLPQNGGIYIGDTKVTKNTLSLIRQRIGFCFQNPDDQLFMPSVYDDVAFGPRNYKFSEEEVDRKVKNALENVGMINLIDRATYKLSGGEKRSVAIAAVLSMDPDILVMDEPTSALDPKARRNLINILKGYTHTKIIATHDLDMVLEICDRLIILKNGEIKRDGLAKDILADKDLLETCGLEQPLSIQNCPICSR